MAASRTQRVSIWIIAIVMAVGSVGFYFVIIIENNRLMEEQQAFQKAQQDLLKAQEPQALPGETAEPFDAALVTELKKEDLKVGDGAEVPSGAKIKVNYMGWTPDGKLFDSSNKGGKVEPIPLGLDEVIVGWKEGIPGMKVGGKRKLTIPAAQAYGETGQPPTIEPNTPLAFIVEVVAIEGQ